MAQSKRFLLRLSPELFEALRRWADDNLRSINAQLEYLLTEPGCGRATVSQAPQATDRRPAPLPPDAGLKG